VANLAVALLSLEADEARLLEFLGRARNPLGRPLFDPKYALRLARERDRCAWLTEARAQAGRARRARRPPAARCQVAPTEALRTQPSNAPRCVRAHAPAGGARA
jgi:hypothetical protein